jgi:hypothetical protein
VTEGKAATVASYRVSHVLSRHKKLFKVWEIKEAFIEATDSGDFKKKTELMASINDIQLSRNTVTRCEGIAENQLKKDIAV